MRAGVWSDTLLGPEKTDPMSAAVWWPVWGVFFLVVGALLLHRGGGVGVLFVF